MFENIFQIIVSHLRVNNEDLIALLGDADEGVDDVGAEVHGDIFNAVASDARPIHCPVAEVTYYARFAVRCRKNKE